MKSKTVWLDRVGRDIKIGDKIQFEIQIEDGGTTSKLTRLVRDLDSKGIFVKVPFWGLVNLIDFDDEDDLYVKVVN